MQKQTQKQPTQPKPQQTQIPEKLSDPYQPIEKVGQEVNRDVEAINQNNQKVADAEQQEKDQQENQSEDQEESDPDGPYHLKALTEHLLGIGQPEDQTPAQSLDPLTSALQKIVVPSPQAPSESQTAQPSEPQSNPVSNLLSLASQSQT